MICDQKVLLNLENISLKYKEQLILKEITLSISSKETVFLIGPNGAGKTSLLKIILGLVRPDTGTVELSAKIGYMPQKIKIDSSLPFTVRKFLLSACKNLKEINKVNNFLEIDKLLDKQLSVLSGGEMQKALLARAILSKPEILILDEPTQGIDIVGKNKFYEILQHLKQDLGCAILMVSHDLHMVMSGTDKVICVNKHICCSGKPDEIKNHVNFSKVFNDASPVAWYTHFHNHKHD